MSGATLPELMLVMSIVSTIAAMAVPAAGRIRDRLAVERQAARLMEAYQRAKALALEAGGGAVLQVGQADVTIYAFTGVDSALAFRAAGPLGDGVGLSTTIDRVLFTPNGLTLGAANGRYTLTRGAVTRELVASRLGRLRVARPRRHRRRR
jgi:Tfp pilus assembly protein FimT